MEYLTSSEAGQPLGSRFAWPVGRIINGCAGKNSSGETEPLLGGVVGVSASASGDGNVKIVSSESLGESETGSVNGNGNGVN